MNEIILQWVQGIKLIILMVYAMLYAWGGISGKWRRRVVAPGILTVGLIGISLWMSNFSFWYLGYYVLLLASTSIGYGDNSKMMKLFKNKIIVRAIVGSAFGVSALPIAIPNSAWLLFSFHVVLCISTMVILGAWNPTKSARAEETMIGFASGFVPIMGII